MPLLDLVREITNKESANATECSFSTLQSNVAHHLIGKNLLQCEIALRALIKSKDGKHIGITQSYEHAVLETLQQSQRQNFVVLEEVLADLVLIPQCNYQDTAFLLEYRIMQEIEYSPPVHAKLTIQAHKALIKINENKYELFVSAFHHVKEIVKIGLSFSHKKKEVSLIHEIVKVNRQF